MNFIKVSVSRSTYPTIVLYNYYDSENGNYRIHKSLNNNKWFSFYKNSNYDSYTLVGPPSDTKAAAITLCDEHSTNLPW